MNAKTGGTRRIEIVAKIALLSVSYVALAATHSGQVLAQTSLPAVAAPSELAPLPAVTINAPRRKPQPKRAQQTRRANTVPVAPVATSPSPAAPAAPVDPQNSRTGTVGVYANSTSVATKINTPLVNIPQSVSVVTREFIQDQSFQSLTEVTRYVPGVAVHQGEGNRDELVIRGVDSSANFFVNGFRDDVQIFRDLYNAQSIEVLKGPSAITFGRGSGGGLLNRTLKEADWHNGYTRRRANRILFRPTLTIDAGQAINENVAARLNAMYEKSDTFRDFGWLERYGINPTVTFKPGRRHQGQSSATNISTTSARPIVAIRRRDERGGAVIDPLQSGRSVRAERRPDRVLRQPDLEASAKANVNTGMAFIDHDFENGLTVKNSTLLCRLSEVLSERLSRQRAAVGRGQSSPTPRSTARPTITRRTAITPSTRPISSTRILSGPVRHTIGFGTEFGRQTGIDLRNTGIFPNGTNTLVADAVQPDLFRARHFHSPVPGSLSDGVTTPDSNSKYHAQHSVGLCAGHDRDHALPAADRGARFDRFDEQATDHEHEYAPLPGRQPDVAADWPAS